MSMGLMLSIANDASRLRRTFNHAVPQAIGPSWVVLYHAGQVCTVRIQLYHIRKERFPTIPVAPNIVTVELQV